jgi:ArsR family transcriptional regulator, arsenate/arsenite/antimonite-responsive transcriptional repressor / arsenate reductase (thioredoxin)
MFATLHQTEPPSVLKLLAHEVRWQALAALARSDYRVHELVALLHRPMNLVSYHLRLLRGEQLVQERRSSADARDVFYSLNFDRFQQLYQHALDEIHPALAAPADTPAPQMAAAGPPARVLFLCTHNSARSQMAEALLRHLAGGRVEAYSAGTEVTRVHPMALATLERQGVSAAGLHSKHLSQFLGQDFDFVITVCDRANESCPIFPGDPERIHWSFPDPSAVTDPEEQARAFARVFFDLEKRLKLLITLIDRERGQG